MGNSLMVYTCLYRGQAEAKKENSMEEQISSTKAISQVEKVIECVRNLAQDVKQRKHYRNRQVLEVSSNAEFFLVEFVQD